MLCACHSCPTALLQLLLLLLLLLLSCRLQGWYRPVHYSCLAAAAAAAAIPLFQLNARLAQQSLPLSDGAIAPHEWLGGFCLCIHFYDFYAFDEGLASGILTVKHLGKGTSLTVLVLCSSGSSHSSSSGSSQLNARLEQQSLPLPGGAMALHEWLVKPPFFILFLIDLLPGDRQYIGL